MYKKDDTQLIQCVYCKDFVQRRDSVKNRYCTMCYFTQEVREGKRYRSPAGYRKNRSHKVTGLQLIKQA